MSKITTYTYTGKKVEPTTVPTVWKGKVNEMLLAQALHVYRDRSHLGLSKTKTRGDLSYTTRKMYAQKGTGNARHGAKSAPIFAGGGTAHGPKGIKRVLTLPKKMRRAALKSAMVRKVDTGRLVLVKGMEKLVKTADSAKLISAIAKDMENKKKFVLALAKVNRHVVKTAKNLPQVRVCLYDNLNAYTVYTGGILIVDQSVLVIPKKESKSKTEIKPKKGNNK